MNSDNTICAPPSGTADQTAVVAGNTLVQVCLDSANHPHSKLNVDIPMSQGEAYWEQTTASIVVGLTVSNDITIWILINWRCSNICLVQLPILDVLDRHRN